MWLRTALLRSTAYHGLKYLHGLCDVGTGVGGEDAATRPAHSAHSVGGRARDMPPARDRGDEKETPRLQVRPKFRAVKSVRHANVEEA